jgi:hypothetical protein
MKIRILPAIAPLFALLTLPLTAQVAPPPFSCEVMAAVPMTLRAEGFTELIGDIILDCIGGVPTRAGVSIPQVNFTIFLNTNATSRILNPSNNLSEAILIVDEPGTTYAPSSNILLCGSASGCAIAGTGILNPGGAITAGVEPYAGTPGRPNVFQGIVSGNQVQFFGVPVDAPGTSGHRVFRFTNIRANGSAISAGPSGTPGTLQAVIAATGSTSVPINNPSQIVAFVQPGMNFTYRGRDDFAVRDTSSGITFPRGIALSRTSSTNSFILRFSEAFSSSFVTVGHANQSLPGYIYGTASGFTQAAALGSIGMADAGTRLKAVFANIPAGVNVYVSVTNYAPFNSPIWNGAVLRSGESGPVTSQPATYTDFAVPPALTNPLSGGGYGSLPAPAPGAGVQLPIVNGTATAVWEVTAANWLLNDNYDFVVWWSYNANVPPLGTAVLSGSFAPTPNGIGISAVTAASASSTLHIPRFVDAASSRAAVTLADFFIVTASLPNASRAVPYSQLLSASGGSGSYTWTIVGSSLPVGLTLNPNGTITGTPTTLGSSAFRVRATDSASAYIEKDLTLTIVDPILITTPSSLGTAVLNMPFVRTLSASGGTGPYTWSLVGGVLPSGLSLANSMITGVPVTVAGSSFRLRVTDTAGAYAERDFTLLVVLPPISILTPSTLWNGTVGQLYGIQMYATGGLGGYRWELLAGSLPAGLSLSSSGSISGTPTAAVNSATFSLRAIDLANSSADGTFTMSVVLGGPKGIPDPVVWYNGDQSDFGTRNQMNGGDGELDTTVFDNFRVPALTRVTCVFSNNRASAGFTATGASWQIRARVSEGFGGDIIASGLTSTGFSWLPTGSTMHGEVEYTLAVTGLNVVLQPGVYWLSVVPVGNRVGASTIAGTAGRHGVGSPKGNDSNSYMSGYFGQFTATRMRLSCPGNCDFSMGIASADATPTTTHVGSYNAGQWRLDVTGNGAFDFSGDRDIFLGWAGATIVTGDWNGDGKTKAGVYSNGYWFLDYDGNGVWDNGVKDKLIAWGWAGAAPMVGDWNGDGKTKIGVYSNGFWFLDYNGDYLWDGGAIDKQVGWGWAGVTPMVGDWNGNGKTKIGVYVNGFWFLDYDGDYLWDGGVIDKQVGWGWSGVTPIVGDWNGDAKTKIGVYSGGYWYLDYDGNYLWQYPGVDKVWSVGWTGTTPVMGDWNGDRKTKAGAFVNGYWYLDYDGNGLFEGIGTDRIFAFGSPGDVPVVGRW